METKISLLDTIDHVKMFYDPLRKRDSFLVFKKGGNGIKTGFIIDEEIVLESNFIFKWNEITSIIGGESDIKYYKKIAEKIKRI